MRIERTGVSVSVPATSANLGPGFDCLGLALGLRDDLEVEALAGGLDIEVQGEGRDEVPRGEDHLVVRALRTTLDYVGAPQAGLRLRAINRIPHGRGLGSSAAAVIAGIALARGLVTPRGVHPDEVLHPAAMLQLASDLEGHPDNAAAALLGGATIAWQHGQTARAMRLPIPAHSVVDPLILSPQNTLATSHARGLLPEQVSHRDAVFAVSRVALLVHALTNEHSDLSLLMDASEDVLHQEYRAPAMPESLDLVRILRQEGYPATISGAGPSVLVLAGVDEDLASIVRRAVGDPGAWRLARPGLDRRGAVCDDI
ncbi:homoserine kinase [Devriesea agamarum]|uniref:homoserine kinase n=1 Tax=Devriesea agamarum TaxID=472569 RepID=UPI00071D5706|nr:homoserine kinase [Devriesea agamarum]